MAPVGSYESLSAAIDAGADSIYFGIGQLNMRSRSSANFTEQDLERIVATAHNHGVKTYPYGKYRNIRRGNRANARHYRRRRKAWRGCGDSI